MITNACGHWGECINQCGVCMLHRVYDASLWCAWDMASLWCAENTMSVIDAMSHHLLCPRSQAVKRFVHWLQNNAEWEMGMYTDGSI